uniref:Uncharacterized protein n=1 Tax=Meloidogyne incognita TaxID=6306 RepID=A0A914KU76_MELIC
MSSLHHKETVSKTYIKICNDGRENGNNNNKNLKTADVKEELATTTGIFNKNGGKKTEEKLIKNNKNIQQPSTSGKNFAEEEDDCLIIFEALNNTTKCSSKKENEISKRQIKDEEITGDYLKKILKEEEKEEMNEESGEDLCSLECIDEEDSNEDFDLRDMDLRMEVGENDLENIQNISNNEEKKEEEEEERGKMIKEEKEEVNEERKDKENEDDEMNDKKRQEGSREDERLIDEEIEGDGEEKIEDEKMDEEEKNSNEDFDMRDVYFKVEVEENDWENSLNDEEEKEEKEKKEGYGEVKEEMDEREADEGGDEEETEEDEETNNQIGEEGGRDDEIVTKEVEEEEEIKEDEEMDEEVDAVIEGEKAEEENYEGRNEEVKEEGKNDDVENKEEEIEEELSKDEEEIAEEEKDFASNELKEKEENPFTTSGNFEEKEKRQEEDRVKDNKPKEDGCLRVILKGNSDSKEKEEKYRRILEEIRSKKQREKDENSRKMALIEGKELPKDIQTISKNKHLTSVDVQKISGDINRMNDYTQRKFEDVETSFEDNIPSTSNDSLITSENTQSPSTSLQTPRQVRASSVDVSSPSKNIQTNSKHERKLSNEIPSTTSTNIQKSKNFKKPRIDNHLNETSTETPLQRNKIKFIPLGDIIVKDRRLEKVDYCIKAINCAKEGVLLPKFKINLINNSDKKENNEKEEEEIKNSDNNNNDESTPMEIEEVGQSSNEGKHPFPPQNNYRFIPTTNFPQFEREHWSVRNVWFHPPPYPPSLAHIIPGYQPFAEDTFASNRNNFAYRSFDSHPSGDIAGNRANVGTSSSVATKLTQTELSYPKDEILENNLKSKTEEITTLRLQLSKKDEELNHLNSLETSTKNLKDRLESKIKLVEEYKNHRAEDGERIKILEKEVEELKKQNYLLELEKKNNNSKKEAKSPALIKAEDEIRQLKKDISEQRRKTENVKDQLRKSDENCKKLNADLKHQKDRYDEWRKQTIDNHKKEINEEISKISAQHKNEVERMSESFSVKQRNSNADAKSQLQLKCWKRIFSPKAKEFEIERLKAENSEERKMFDVEKQKVLDNYKRLEENWRRTNSENLQLQQINNSNLEEWKRTELARHRNGFNNEIIRIKEEFKREMDLKNEKLNQSLENERQTDKKYSELLEATEELKKKCFWKY